MLDRYLDSQSTRYHIRAAFEHAGLDQATVRAIFAAISPRTWAEQFARSSREAHRQNLVVYATYDLTFPRAGSLAAVQGFRDLGVAYQARVLPCGHYTTGEFPYKYLDGFYLGHFVWSAFRALRREPERLGGVADRRSAPTMERPAVPRG